MDLADARLNLTKANVLLVDGSVQSLDMIRAMLKGFGVGSLCACETIAEAQKSANSQVFELVLIDPSTEIGAGFEFVKQMRRSEGRNASAPVIALVGHVCARDVLRIRDIGANFVIAKPISAAALLERILWVVRDQRPFVAVTDYVGPDRRHKFEGPPLGSDGRRGSDLKAPLAAAAEEENLSQNEIDEMLKPRRVVI